MAIIEANSIASTVKKPPDDVYWVNCDGTCICNQCKNSFENAESLYHHMMADDHSDDDWKTFFKKDQAPPKLDLNLRPPLMDVIDPTLRWMSKRKRGPPALRVDDDDMNPNSYRRKEEDVKPSRVHETLKDGNVNVSLDRKFNDHSVSDHEVASCTGNLVETGKPPKSKKLTMKLRNQPKRIEYHNCEVPDLTISLSGRNVVDRKRGGLPLKVKENVIENDKDVIEKYEDVIEAAETIMMMSRGLRPPMAESTGDKRCLGYCGSDYAIANRIIRTLYVLSCVRFVYPNSSCNFTFHSTHILDRQGMKLKMIEIPFHVNQTNMSKDINTSKNDNKKTVTVKKKELAQQQPETHPNIEPHSESESESEGESERDKSDEKKASKHTTETHLSRVLTMDLTFSFFRSVYDCPHPTNITGAPDI
ncbi:hypothetical protein LXL04_022559 [Taraxacum kok-saghyz]